MYEAREPDIQSKLIAWIKGNRSGIMPFARVLLCCTSFLGWQSLTHFMTQGGWDNIVVILQETFKMGFHEQQGKSEGFDSCDRPSNLKLDSNRQFFLPCDREIWWMTLQNNRAPLLCYFKLCASFRIHWWISSTQVSDSHLSPPGALQSRRASLQWT